MTSLLEQAQELLNKQHLTIGDVKELERIESQATGEEAIMIEIIRLLIRYIPRTSLRNA